jgi:hypothetical protein
MIFRISGPSWNGRPNWPKETEAKARALLRASELVEEGLE